MHFVFAQLAEIVSCKVICTIGQLHGCEEWIIITLIACFLGKCIIFTADKWMLNLNQRTMAVKQIVFRSRISVLLMILIAGVLMFGSIAVFRSGDSVEMGVFIGAFLFVMLVLSGIRYVISESTLSLHIWFIRVMRINIKSIRSIERSYNPLSSPAASLKRLGVTFTKNAHSSYILISPVDEEQFIAQLKLINPYIDINIPEKKDDWNLLDWDV